MLGYCDGVLIPVDLWRPPSAAPGLRGVPQACDFDPGELQTDSADSLGADVACPPTPYPFDEVFYRSAKDTRRRIIMNRCSVTTLSTGARRACMVPGRTAALSLSPGVLPVQQAADQKSERG